MTLLLLLTSSGGPKPVDAAIPAQVDLTAAATLKSPVTPVAEINIFGSAAGDLQSRTAQAAAAISAITTLAATARQATDRAAEQIITFFSLSADLRNSTQRADAQADAAVTVTASLRNPTQRVDAQVIATTNLSAYATLKVPVTPDALIIGRAEVYVRIPARTLSGVASAGAGRSGSGNLTGSGRGTAGTATSAPGRQ